jgi:hypothetical protein
MKKIIAAVDALHFSENELLRYNTIAIKLEAKLHIIFLENIFFQSTIPTDILSQEAYSYYAEVNWENIEKRREEISEKIILFHKTCKQYDIDATIHEEHGMPLEDIVKESRFADLLLVMNTTSFAKTTDSNPPKFVKDVLRQAECPVLILPVTQKDIKQVVLTYNGSFSSVYAIKHFANLFTNFRDIEATLLVVSENNKEDIPHEALIKAYLNNHFTKWKIKKLIGEPAVEITSYVMRNSDCIITMGAYSRSKLSQFFHHSEAERLLQMINTYTFITHP